MITSTRGFTLIELMVAVLVLTVGVIGLASTMSLTTNMIGRSQRYAEAAALAAEKMEILRTQDCDTMTSGSELNGDRQAVWRVTATAGGEARLIMVRVRFGTHRSTGWRVDAFTTIVSCRT